MNPHARILVPHLFYVGVRFSSWYAIDTCLRILQMGEIPQFKLFYISLPILITSYSLSRFVMKRFFLRIFGQSCWDLPKRRALRYYFWFPLSRSFLKGTPEKCMMLNALFPKPFAVVASIEKEFNHILAVKKNLVARWKVHLLIAFNSNNKNNESR